MNANTPEAHADLLQRLFVRGLGEELVLHVVGDNVVLGQLCLKKNRLTLSDTRYLTGVRPADVAACFESGMLGMVSASQQYQWASLTFHGLNQCKVKVDLSQTRGSRLQSTRDADGDELMDYVGSVYRGFRLMLDHHFLPVVTLRPLQAKNEDWGFAVVDLRMAAIDLAAVRIVNDVVRRSTERHFEVDLIEENVQNEQFEELFGGFLGDKARAGTKPSTAAAVKAAPSAPPPVPGAAPARAAPAPATPAQVPVQAATPAASQVVVPISAVVAAAAPGRMPAAAPAQVAATSALAPVDVLQQVLGMLREMITEIGAPRAFEIFERWAGREAEARARALLQGEEFDLRSTRDFFEAISAQLRKAGENHLIVAEEGSVITHEIRDCVYREACRRSGVDPEGRWSTCAQAIPSVRARAAAALDGRLVWTWTNCDRRSGHPCIFELALSEPRR